MIATDVEGFIASHKAKLNQDKANMNIEDRRQMGVGSIGERASERADKLRQERQSEYLDYIKLKERDRSHSDVSRTTSRVKSVEEIRHQLARDREQELSSPSQRSSNDRIPANDSSISNSNVHGRRDNGHDYASLKQRKLAEERQYRGHMMHDDHIHRRERRRWNDEDDDRPVTYTKVRFDDGDKMEHIKQQDSRGPGYPTTSQRWENDERDLMQWTKNQTRPGSRRTQRTRSSTPPVYVSPRRSSEDNDRKSLRSISVPDMAPSITNLGARESEAQVIKRKRQMEYAEELRAQMRANEETKFKNRAKDEELEQKRSVPRSRERQSQSKPPHNRHRRSNDENDPPPGHDYHYNDARRERLPPKAHFQEAHNRYNPYHPPPPPPPPHRYHPDPRDPWMAASAYYGKPPHGHSYHQSVPEFEYNPYSDPHFPTYHNPSYLHAGGPGNPYLPPHVPYGAYPSHGPPKKYRDEHESDYYRGRKDPDEREYRDRGRGKEPHRGGSFSSSARRREKEDDTELSPLHGVGSQEVKVDKAQYRAELERQVREKKEREKKIKLDKERYETKKDMEIYDPFGKGGCGAPVRDQQGNLVADLKRMRKINEDRLNDSANSSPVHQPLSTSTDGAIVSPNNTSKGGSTPSPRVVLNYDKRDDETVKKVEQDSYRDYLRKQVEAKEALKKKEKELQKLEELKELEQLERDRKKLQEDYKLEKERQRKKEEDARNKNEALKRAAEIKRQMAAMKEEEILQREEAESRRLLDERQWRNTTSLSDNVDGYRPKSPPIPTLRHKMNQFSEPPPPHTSEPTMGGTYRSSSPPVPALRKNKKSKNVQQQEIKEQDSVLQSQQTPQSNSPPVPTIRKMQQKSAQTLSQSGSNDTTSSTGAASNVLTQLAAIRMQLQSQLAKQYPYIQKEGSIQSQTSSHQSDIFERVKQQKPKVAAPRVKRRNDSGLDNAMDEFTSIKYRHPSTRKEFFKQFPDPPRSESTLEVQQQALLQHQNRTVQLYQSDLNRDVRQERQMGGTDLLNSDSVQLPIELRDLYVSKPVVEPQLNGIQQNPATIPQVQASRRKQWDNRNIPSAGGQSQFSVTTFDVDSLAAKTEERRRRLDAILNAGSNKHQDSVTLQPEASLNHNNGHDPQTILHDFLRRNDGERLRGSYSRQSEQSLDCETEFQQISSTHT